MPIAKLANAYKLLDPEIRAKNIALLKRAAKGMVWELTRPTVPDPIFVVGCSRSGTTVTYETIAASTALRSIGHEIPQFWNGLSGPHATAGSPRRPVQSRRNPRTATPPCATSTSAWAPAGCSTRPAST